MARKIPTWVLVLGLAGAYWWLTRTVSAQTPTAPAAPAPTLAQSITNLFGTGS